MKKILILVEGKADAKFLKDYIDYLFSKNNIDVLKEIKDKTINSNSSKAEIKKYENENYSIVIFVMGGCTKFQYLGQQILEYKDKHYIPLTIHDADNPSKPNGGVESRTKYIKAETANIKLTLEDEAIFLLPNNKDDGDLETLLLNLVEPTKYKNFEDCYKSYTTCIKNHSSYSEELLEDKYKTYNYVQNYQGRDKANEEKRAYNNSNLWNLDAAYLEPLKEFIEKHIIN